MNTKLVIFKDFLWIYIIGISVFTLGWQTFSGISFLVFLREYFGPYSLVVFSSFYLTPLLSYTFLQVRWVRVLLCENL